MAANSYNAIVIGGGHNGLVAAAYLAKAGARVVVCESRHKTGGAAATDRPGPSTPSSSVTTLSYVMSLMPDTIVPRPPDGASTGTGSIRWVRTWCRCPTVAC